jgi:hypothetical protein
LCVVIVIVIVIVVAAFELNVRWSPCFPGGRPGIEATFHHLDTGVYIRVVFHTPATYASAADMKKALAEAYTMTVSVRAERGDHFCFDLIVSFLA